jgi:glycosyltransferase involved in cell wall biosynthesis
MILLSAVIIAKNEEEMIADCIDALDFCDEIVLIDNESSDRTVEIAKHLGAKVYVDARKSFADRRNMGKERAKGKWILYVDADERIGKELAEEITEKITKKESEYVAYEIPRRDYRYGGVKWEYVGYFTRLFEKKHLKTWFGDLHESSKVDGNIGKLSSEMQHFTHRDLSQMLAKTIQWSGTEAKLRFDAHHPPMSWWRFPRVMIKAFFDSYIKEKGYKSGTAGLIEGIYQAYSMFITYARLWEMQQSDLTIENSKTKVDN